MADTILKAVRINDLASLKRLIKNGHALDVRDNQGFTALHEAASLKQADCMILLLKKVDNKALIDARSHDLSTALHVGVLRNCLECVDLLLKAGADINLPSHMGYSPLHTAVENQNYEMVERLVTNPKPPNYSQLNYEDIAPIEIAFNHFYSDIIKLMLRNGADKVITGVRDFIFFSFKDHNMARTILDFYTNEHSERNLPHIRDCCVAANELFKPENTHLVYEDYYSFRNFDEIFRNCLVFNNFDSFNILYHFISPFTPFTTCKFLLLPGRETDPRFLDFIFKNTQDLKESHPISIFEHNEHLGFLSTIDPEIMVTSLTIFISQEASVEQVKLFLTHGAHVEPTHTQEITPLMMAAITGNLPLVHLLITRGAPLNAYLLRFNFNFTLASIHDNRVLLYLLACGAEAESLFKCTKNKEDFIDYLKFRRRQPVRLINFIETIVNFIINFEFSTKWHQVLNPQDFHYIQNIAAKPRSLLHLCTMATRKNLDMREIVNDPSPLLKYLPVNLITHITTCGLENI